MSYILLCSAVLNITRVRKRSLPNTSTKCPYLFSRFLDNEYPSTMTRLSNLETWIDIAKLGVAAGELAPFPYIKGLCGCAVLVLEAIEKAGKNNEDLLDLADSIGKTIEMIQNTVTEQGESSDVRFRDICGELEVYLTDLHVQLNSTRRKSRGISRFLKTKNVSDTINGYRERVRAIKQDFLICTAIDSRLVISDIKDGLRASTDALTSTIETSRRLTVSNIDKLGADVQTLKERGFYKGFIRDVPPGDVYLREHLNPSDGLYSLETNDDAVFSDHSADVDGSNTPKIVRVYRGPRGHSDINEQEILKRFHKDVDILIHLKHPNFAQIFGVCRSPFFTAIILHGTLRDTVRNHCTSLTAIQLLQFNIQLFNDLESASDYLGSFYHQCPHGWTDYAFDGDLSSVYINERGRIVFTGLSSQYDLFYYMMDIIQDSEVRPELTLLGPPVALDTPPSGVFRNLNSLLRCTILDKNYLIDIYDALYVLTYTTDVWAYPPGLQFPYDLGSISTRTELTPPVDCLVVGQILLELTEQAVRWEVVHNNGDSTSVLPVCSGSPTTHYLSVVQNHCLVISPNYLWTSEYFTNPRRMVYSLFAQASRLSLSRSQNLTGSNHRVHDMKDVEVCHHTPFELQITPCYDPFQLLDTFMADSEYIFALSLTVCEPHLDPQSNKFSWPVIHWFAT
ncbi:hypothetical protein ARMSODRAFT_540743 [Armillaria solidipes]|uniref:Protein kinase domain-containing protein n=1 Tax=Armillaria solidipes TaxID=1076256 RepID=A0A2H3BFJ7_9AGAR|nr:hypothetical protein ARMSODRAFT_540743 [Armillaria solidipes]